MGRLPFLRFFLFTGTILAFAAVVGYLAFAYQVSGHDDPRLATSIAATVALLVPGFFLIRWWLSEARAAGVPLLVTSRANAIRYGVSIFALIAAAGAAEYGLYAALANRALEIVSALAVVGPIGFFLFRNAYANMDPPKPQEGPTLRVSAFLNLLVPLLFAFNLVLLVASKHPAPERDILIPFYIVLIAIQPSAAYFMWRRANAASRLLRA